MPRARRFIPQLIVASLMLGPWTAWAEQPAENYEFDFSNSRFDADALVPIGYDSPFSMQFIRPERSGLRIAIPSSQGRSRPKMGLFAAFKLEGDFEITAGFDLVKADAPNVGMGVGANLYIMAERSLNGATLRRCVGPDGQEAFFVHWALRQADGSRRAEMLYAPAQSREGKLRLARTGTTLSYLVAEADDLEFREIKALEFGADPVSLIQLQAVTDGAAKNVDMLWRTISIRADKRNRIDIPLLQRPPVK